MSNTFKDNKGNSSPRPTLIQWCSLRITMILGEFPMTRVASVTVSFHFCRLSCSATCPPAILLRVVLLHLPPLVPLLLPLSRYTTAATTVATTTTATATSRTPAPAGPVAPEASEDMQGSSARLAAGSCIRSDTPAPPSEWLTKKENDQI